MTTATSRIDSSAYRVCDNICEELGHKVVETSRDWANSNVLVVERYCTQCGLTLEDIRKEQK